MNPYKLYRNVVLDEMIYTYKISFEFNIRNFSGTCQILKNP
jgi:hypothetical protein